jgi:hypothetical protein
LYAGDFIIPKDTRFVLAIAEKKGIYSEKLEIPINWSKPEGIKIDKTKRLTYEKRNMYKTNNNKSTYEELELFNKYGATFEGIFQNFSFTMNAKPMWSSVQFDDSLNLNKEKLESMIDAMRNTIEADSDFETALQIRGIVFPSGQLFLDWMAEKQMQHTNLKQEEIIQ